jgi:hypothetical protein
LRNFVVMIFAKLLKGIFFYSRDELFFFQRQVLVGKPGRFAAFSSPPITAWRQSANGAAIGRSGVATGVCRHDAEPTAAGGTATTPTEYKLHRTAVAENNGDDDAQFIDGVVRSALPATATAVFSTAAVSNSRQVTT